MIGKVEFYQDEKTKKKWREFTMKLCAILATLGLSFFIIAHLQFIPIADRMVINCERPKVKNEKNRRSGKKSPLLFYHSTGFPRSRVFAT